MIFEKTNTKLMQKSIFYGFIIAISVLLLGFGGMYILWNNAEYPSGLPGLFDYKAATIGDGICLPVLMFAMVAFCKYNEDINVKSKKYCWITTICSMCVGCGIQMQWLISDKTKLNWSLPLKHHFNMAGWYHSIFFVFMFGMIAYMFVCMWNKIHKRNGAYSFFEMIMLVMFSGAGSSFIFLFLADDYETQASIYKMFPLASLIIIILLVIFLKSSLSYCKEVNIFSYLIGVSCGCGIILFLCNENNGDMLIALGGGLCIGFLFESREYKTSHLVLLMSIIVPCYFGLFYVVTSIDKLEESIWLIVFIAIITFLIEKLREKEYFWHNAIMIFVLLYVLLMKSSLSNIIFFEGILDSDEVINALFYISVYIVFNKEIKYVFATVIDGEKQINSGMITKEDFRRIKQNGYFIITISIVAILTLLSHWIIDNTKRNGAQIVVGQINFENIFVFGVMIFFVFVMILLSMRKSKSGIIKVLGILFAIIVDLALIMIISLRVGNSIDFRTWNIVQWIMFGCSMFAAVGAPLLEAYGFLMNLTYLRGRTTNKYIKCMSAVLVVFNFLIIAASIILLLTKCTWVNVGIVLGSMIIAFELTPIICVKILYDGENKKSHVVPNTALGGVCQDGFSSILLIIFEIYMPCIYIGIIKKYDFNLFMSVAGLITSALMVVAFFLKNNVEHVARQKKVLIDHPDEVEQWKTLKYCLKRQNCITAFAMLPYVILKIIGKRIVDIGKHITRKESIHKLISEYITEDEKEKSDE